MSQDRETKAEAISQAAVEKTTQLPIELNDAERLVLKGTDQDITKAERAPDRDMAKEMVDLLRQAIGVPQPQQHPGPIEYGQDTGKFIRVNIGDHIAYSPTKGGKGKYRGGWFKCSEDQPVDNQVTQVARSMVSFTYDEGRGELYHNVKFKTVRMFRKSQRNNIVVPNEAERRFVETGEYSGV